ncbi:methyltransferase domain-containing protein [Nonomuraea rhizosphaerae]|uniref:methyltransferase domain-containing protein n=1 Tax=Nonomuraea rhizosphaerae TaxID=2665663 RepID=UPI001C5DEC30|nr:methyltransferase domain-containing protein [Nonomuraea rhizosphaerae]
MNRFEGEPAAAELAGKLADELVESGDITDPGWREIFAAVPRHVFVPHFARAEESPEETRYALLSSGDPARHDEWLNGVYSNEALPTQINGHPVEELFAEESGPGCPSSSSTSPGLMAWMLETLDLGDGDRVLEAGTGTGYNAALLGERLGSDRVTSIDIDAHLTALARERLAAIGLHPTVVTGDGRNGYPPDSPYDRVISTFGLGYVPAAWIEQTRPGGRILVHIGGMLGGAMLLAEVGEGNTAHGRFLTRWATFAPSRHPTLLDAARDGESSCGRTLLEPELLADPAFGFLAELHVPRARLYRVTGKDGRIITGLKRHDGSWAEIHEPDFDGSRWVEQGGPERLWDRVEDAYVVWEKAGRPDWSQFTFEARPESVQVVRLEERPWRLPVPAPASGPHLRPAE